METKTTKHNCSKQSPCLAESIGSLKNEGSDLLTSPILKLSSAGGKFVRIRNPEHRAKAERFWNGLRERRRTPGNCSRCGKPHGGQFRQCDHCRERCAVLKAKRQAKGMELAQCIAMVKQCRREVTKLRAIIKQMKLAREREYQKDWKHKRELRKYHDAYGTITKQELATMNHAYETD